MRLLTVVAVLLGSLAPVLAQAQERWGWHGDMHPMWWMWGAGGVMMMLLMVVFWAVVIGAIVMGVRALTRAGRGDRRDRALEILRERYARGEINREEFEARKRDLA